MSIAVQLPAINSSKNGVCNNENVAENWNNRGTSIVPCCLLLKIFKTNITVLEVAVRACYQEAPKGETKSTSTIKLINKLAFCSRHVVEFYCAVFLFIFNSESSTKK